MSMIGYCLRISASTLSDLLHDSDAAEAILFPANGPEPRVLASVDLDHAWHLIHFLLTGEAWNGAEPLRSVIQGGEVLADLDMGYGPPRYLPPAKVVEVSKALAQISPEEFWSRFDAGGVKAAEIYPGDWEGTDEDREYITEVYAELRDLYVDAANAGDAVIQFVS